MQPVQYKAKPKLNNYKEQILLLLFIIVHGYSTELYSDVTLREGSHKWRETPIAGLKDGWVASEVVVTNTLTTGIKEVHGSDAAKISSRVLKRSPFMCRRVLLA